MREIKRFNAIKTKNRKNPALLSRGVHNFINQQCTQLIAQSGLYSFISHKSAAADEKRTLVGTIQPGV